MRSPDATLLDIHQAGRLAVEFARDVPDAAAFARDVKTRAAVLHELTVLGEAVKRLPQAFRDAHPTLPWRRMAGMRDVLIHAYDAVDDALVWEILHTELPPVLDALAPLLPTR